MNKGSNLFSAGLLSATLIFGIGCNAAKDDPKSSKPKVDLTGTWDTGCVLNDHQNADSTDDQSSQTTLVSDGTTWIMTQHAYMTDGDGACATETFNAVMTGTVKVSGKSSSVDGAYELDVTHSSSLLTFADAAQVAGANSMGFCGSSSWAQNVPFDIAGTADADCVDSVGFASYSKFYTIGKISGSTLTLGEPTEGMMGDTADTRPTSLSAADFLFTKQ